MSELLGPLAASEGERRAEFGKRNKAYVEETIQPELREKYENDGWWLQRENKTSLRMRADRPFDEILENRFWAILHRFGYSELNRGRDFKIATAKDGSRRKQVDVFAKDDETVVIAECKACATPRKRALQKDIAELASYQKAMSDAIRKHYGDGYNPKIIWCFVTNNVRWSKRDEEHAAEHNIHVIKDVELLYFEEFAKKLGKAARHQFQAEYLSDQKVPALQDRKVPAVRTQFGKTKAYLFSALPRDILRISFVNHRDLRDPSGAPSYQRIVKPNRLREIGDFLDGGGFFPNTILLNFHRSPRFEQTASDKESGIAFGNLILPEKFKSCWVIDGQHRLYGTVYTEEEYDQPLYFIGFDKVSQANEAEIFLQINSKQDKVPPALLSALDGEVKWESEDPKEKLQAIASRTIDFLNLDGGGPLEGKVNSPGITGGKNKPLSVRSIQNAIVNSGLIGEINARTGDLIPGPCSEGSSRATLERLVDLLTTHFENVAEQNKRRWHAGKAGYLCSNFGIGSHIRLVHEGIMHVAQRDGFAPQASEIADLYESISPLFEPVLKVIETATDDEFEGRFKTILGSSGYQEYFFEMVNIIREADPSFKPEGYEEYKRATSSGEVQWADRQVRWIQSTVHKYVMDKLRLKHGTDFFEKSVPKEIQKKTQGKRIDDDNQLQVDAYLDWIQLKPIVTQASEREAFKESLSIQFEGENSGKHFYDGWFDTFNRIRRPAHPTGRMYSEKDIQALEAISSALQERLPGAYVEDAPDATIS